MLTHTDHRHRGSTYLVVLGASMILTIVGMSAILLARIQLRTVERANNVADTRLYAQSAIEVGMYMIDANPDWRNSYPNGQWFNWVPMGQGYYRLLVTDPTDGNIADSIADPVVLTGVAMKGVAAHQIQVQLDPELAPIEALNFAVHVNDELHIKAGKWITVQNAPVSTNGNLRNDGYVEGDAEAVTTSGGGDYLGTLTVPAPTKPMPDATVFQQYVDIATQLPYGNIVAEVIAPERNSYSGTLNPDGVYYINTGGGNITIRASRIHGTLVIDAGAGTVTITGPVFLHNYRPDYPVLIVRGTLELDFNSYGDGLVEEDWRNFNPNGAPFDDETDFDVDDEYPSEIWGLVHCIGPIFSKQEALVHGAIIGEDRLTINEPLEVIHDRELEKDPPVGYRVVERMEIAEGSWRQLTN